MRSVYLFGTLAIAVFAAGLSFVLSYASSKWAYRLGAVDQPSGGRKIHTRPIPLFGGVGIAITILIGIVFIWSQGLFADLGTRQLIGFVAGIIILAVGGMTDDISARSAGTQIVFPILASLAVVASGTGIVQVTNPSGGGLSLVWWKISNISLPADVLTVCWLLFATYATKFLDGLDGLVTGLAVIGASMVGAHTLSAAYYQPGVAMLSGLVGGSFLGFLPRAAHPAKQFLGDLGSTLAGFALGFLAIVSSAKVAIALAVIAIPLADAVFVVLNRIRRGKPPWVGDATHLHFRLLRAGVPHRTAVFLYWVASFVAGILALSLQTRGKTFLIIGLCALTGTVSWVVGRIARESSTT